MSDFSRRSVLAGAAAITCNPVVSAAATRRLSIPSGPMDLQRTITRGLGLNAYIAVTRSWVINFAMQGSGVIVSGKQIDVEVDAPSSLEAFAQLERSRSTNAMFPMMLSDLGLLISAKRHLDSDDVQRALEEARQVIEARDLSDDNKAAQLAGLAELQRNAGSMLQGIPPDLFFPMKASSKAVESVLLPGGMTGEFELHYNAECASDAPWLKRSERRVITRIGDSERRSSDVWTMTQS